MTTTPQAQVSEERLGWKVHTPQLLEEILTNKGTEILRTPLGIFGSLLHEVATRASELNDPTLNLLMLRLTLYDAADPALHSSEEIAAAYASQESALSTPPARDDVAALGKARPEGVTDNESDPTPFPGHKIENPNDGMGLKCSRCGKRGATLSHPCRPFATATQDVEALVEALEAMHEEFGINFPDGENTAIDLFRHALARVRKEG